MRTQRSWRGINECRPFAAAIVTAAMLAICFHPASAQDDESGVDDNTFVGPNFGWSVEWDEDIWEFAEEDNSGGADFLVLKTVDDGETPFGYVRLFGVEGLFADPDECAEGWEERIADRDGNSNVEATDEYDVPRAPRGGAAATYIFTFDDEDGRSFDDVEYVQCQYIEEDGALLIVWLFSTTDEFEEVVPLFEDLVATIEIPEDGGDSDGQGNQDDEDGDNEGQRNQDDEGTDEEGTDEDEDRQDDGGADTGIDGASYTSPTYGFSVEWDEEVWTANPDAELVNEGTVGLDRLYIEHAEDGDLYSGFYIEAKADYDGDVADCIEGEEDLLTTDETLIDLEPYEDDQGDPIAGESEAGGEYAAFYGTYEDDGGDEYDLVWYLECQTLEEGESVTVFSLFTNEASYEDELELAQEVIASLET